MDKKKLAYEIVKIAKGILSSGEEEIEGKNIRIIYSRDKIQIEELPVKGKKKLRIYNMSVNSGYLGRYINYPLVYNIIKSISKNDSYERAVGNLESAVEDFKDWAPKEQMKSTSGFSNLNSIEEGVRAIENAVKKREEQVNYLKIAPVDTKPIKVKGKDFEITAYWDEFNVMMYDSEEGKHSHNPSYTGYSSSSPVSARKFYKIVSADPNVLKNVSSFEFHKWLNDNKIKYKMYFSQW